MIRGISSAHASDCVVSVDSLNHDYGAFRQTLHQMQKSCDMIDTFGLISGNAADLHDTQWRGDIVGSRTFSIQPTLRKHS
jgi:molybdopterin biosynthesis enzyme